MKQKTSKRNLKKWSRNYVKSGSENVFIERTDVTLFCLKSTQGAQFTKKILGKFPSLA